MKNNIVPPDHDNMFGGKNTELYKLQHMVESAGPAPTEGQETKPQVYTIRHNVTLKIKFMDRVRILFGRRTIVNTEIDIDAPAKPIQARTKLMVFKFRQKK